MKTTYYMTIKRPVVFVTVKQASDCASLIHCEDDYKPETTVAGWLLVHTTKGPLILSQLLALMGVNLRGLHGRRATVRRSQARRMRKEGLSLAKIAKELGVTVQAVYAMLKKED